MAMSASINQPMKQITVVDVKWFVQRTSEFC